MNPCGALGHRLWEGCQQTVAEKDPSQNACGRSGVEMRSWLAVTSANFSAPAGAGAYARFQGNPAEVEPSCCSSCSSTQQHAACPCRAAAGGGQLLHHLPGSASEDHFPSMWPQRDLCSLRQPGHESQATLPLMPSADSCAVYTTNARVPAPEMNPLPDAYQCSLPPGRQHDTFCPLDNLLSGV